MDLERVLSVAVRLLPARRAEYGRALLAELAAVPPADRARWARGGLGFVCREVLVRPVLYLAGVVTSVTVLIAVDRSASDVGNQSALLVLLLCAAALGVGAPRWAWWSGAAVGCSLAAAHAAYLAEGIALPYRMSPAGWAGPATLLVLVVPALAAAHAGARLGTLIRRHQATH